MKAIVLAAGKGSRLQSEKFNLPKVLRRANGRPLIGYVLDSINFIAPEDTEIVVGYMREKVMEELGDKYSYSVQAEQLGTGHAVMCTREHMDGYDGQVLICYGDMPLVKPETYQNLVAKHIESGAACTLLTAVEENPPAYGRIVRDADGKLSSIVEDKDCTPEQKLIQEVNVGIYVFDAKELMAGLSELKNTNAQNEYYLTDMPQIFVEKGLKVEIYSVENSTEYFGVNTMEDLAFCENELKKR